MRLQSEVIVTIIFLIAAGITTVLLYNLLYPHFKNINPVGQSIAESLKINFQLLDYFVQNNTLFVYVKPSEPVNASQVFAIVNNKLVYVTPVNSNSTIVNPYDNGLLLIVANLSQIPIDQNGNYKVEVGLENDVIGTFTIHYVSNILQQFFPPVVQYNVTLPTTNTTSSPPSNTTNTTSSTPPSSSPPSNTTSSLSYYALILYNTQNIPTPSPFQQDIAICNGSGIPNYYFNTTDYNITYGNVTLIRQHPTPIYSTNPNITLYTSDIYLCLAAGNVSFSINYNPQENSSGYAIVGYSNSNNCSASFSGSSVPSITVGGYSINTTEYSFLNGSSYFSGTTFNDVTSFSFNYSLSNLSNVTISIACGVSACNLINIPSGCNIIFDNTSSDNYTTVFSAFCPNQSPGNYSINGTLLNYGYVALGLYIFNPSYTKLPIPSYVSNLTLFNLINSNGSNVYFFSNTSNPTGSLLYSWYEGQENFGGAYCDVWWINISSGIPANSNYTIYMHIGNSSNNYYSQYYPYVGAPIQVLGTSQYDNGNYVFNYYQNFGNLTSLPSGWETVYNSVSPNFSTYYLILPPEASPYNSGITTINNYSILNNIVEAELSIPVSSGTSWDEIVFGIGNASTTSTYFIGGGGGLIAGGNNDGAAFSYNNNGNTGLFELYSGNTTIGSTYYNNITTIYGIGLNSTTIDFYINYTTVGYSNTSPSSTSLPITIAQQDSGQNYLVYWVRIRSYPPNGVMPEIFIQ
ncbi:hypothetical protein YN1_3250 [Nanoarchaeota archaeon]